MPRWLTCSARLWRKAALLLLFAALPQVGSAVVLEFGKAQVATSFFWRLLKVLFWTSLDGARRFETFLLHRVWSVCAMLCALKCSPAKGMGMAESKRQLAAALEQLMEQKPLDQVRVSEIVALAGVSKQTFYHHFTDKYHLMEHCFRDMFAQQFDRMGTLAPFSECYAEFLERCHECKTFLRNGFTSQDVNSLYRVMHHALRDAYGRRVRVYGVADEGAVGFYLDFFSKGCAGCTRHWFDQGMDFSDEQLVNLICQCIPIGAAQYFE